MTQSELVGLLQRRYSISMDRSALARIETGDRHVFDYELAAISAALDRPLEAFLPRMPATRHAG
jgi:transcriptional regulator with XRE-family HTH domain